MSKEQIEEIANVIYDDPNAYDTYWRSHCERLAETLYNASYRKQEWISLEERLPEVCTDVLVITADGSFKIARCNIYHNGTLVLWMTNDGLGERAITHWMPLPTPPKMKGEDNGTDN